jgi:hypothetical protein
VTAAASSAGGHDLAGHRDVVVDEITAWQSRPVDPVYLILYIDAIRIKVCDGVPLRG